MDLQNNLLGILPAYPDGRTSCGVYNAGGGLYDERVLDEYTLLVEEPTEMDEDEFRNMIEGFLAEGIPGVREYSDTFLQAKFVHEKRLQQIVYRDGKASAYFADEYVPCQEDKSNLLRTVIGTSKSAFLSYIESLKEQGFSVLYQNRIEQNLALEIEKADNRYWASYTAGDRTARFAESKTGVSAADFGYTAVCDSRTEIYQFGLVQKHFMLGTYTDCGMNYAVKLGDNSFFLVDGGQYIQATDEVVKEYYHFLRERAGLKDSEKLRIAGWFCTHAHNDHFELFVKMLRFYHEEIELERVIFNFPSPQLVNISPENWSMMNRINRLYPDVQYIKPHLGLSFTLADTKFEVLQTHEDFMAYGCNEIPGDFNNTSTVLKLTFNGKTMLFLGDISEMGEALLLRHYTADTLKSDAMQAAHHVFNLFYYLYDVIDADFAFLPTEPATRTNHDRHKYERIAMSVPEENIFFASEDGTHGIGVVDGELRHIYEAPMIGGAYDGSDV